MSTVVLFIELLLVHFATLSPTQIQADCNENITLQCTGISGMSYHSVTWYKLINKDRTGIVRYGRGETKYFNPSWPARFGEQHGLFLPSVTPGDSGTYECAIGAIVGGKNVNYTVTLTVPVCTTQAYLTTVADKLNVTHTAPPCSIRIEEVSVMWSVLGYLGLGLLKIGLSVVTIWVVRAIRNKSSRQTRRRWQRSL